MEHVLYCVNCTVLLTVFLYNSTNKILNQSKNKTVIGQIIDDQTVIGQIINNNESAYRDEISLLALWCQENSFTLNIDKTKESEEK